MELRYQQLQKHTILHAIRNILLSVCKYVSMPVITEFVHFWGNCYNLSVLNLLVLDLNSLSLSLSTVLLQESNFSILG